jgi:hypothetical protein
LRLATTRSACTHTPLLPLSLLPSLFSSYSSMIKN